LDYSTSKRVRVTPDIVEYSGETPPMCDLILGKQSLHGCPAPSAATHNIQQT